MTRHARAKLAGADVLIAVLMAFLLGPFAYLYTGEYGRMAAAVLGQLAVFAAYGAAVVMAFRGGFRITSLACGPLDQALVASPAIVLGVLLLAIAMNVLVAIDLAWRIARARRNR